jgi:predicted nucleotidyltransferase component of viral defense system
MNLLLDTAKKFSKGNKLLEMTIIKELLHYDILDALNQSEITEKLVFQGGTSLRLCYNAIRYSEDLDFCLKDKKDFSKELMKAFDEIFVKTIKRKYGFEAEVTYKEKAENIDKNRNVNVQKWIAKIILNSNDRFAPKQKINIEIANVPSHDYHISLVKNRYYNFTASIPIQVESLKELLADKIIALATRGFFKARDYWDIYYLNNENVKLDRDLVKKKIDDYLIVDFDEKLHNITQSLFEENHNSFSQLFRTEMGRFLTDDDYKYAQNQDFIDSVFKAVQSIVNNYNEQSENQANKVKK